MKVIEEQKDAMPRQREIVEYERNATDTIEQCYKRLKSWFAFSKTFIVGKGGNHVFVSDAQTKKRVLLITT